jgi:hypothetical protein
MTCKIIDKGESYFGMQEYYCENHKCNFSSDKITPEECPFAREERRQKK